VKLLQTQVKEVHLIFEVPFSELEKIGTALSKGKFEYDGNNIEEKEAVNYLTNEFYPFIMELLESMKGKKNG
jgi:hypothetical protein